MEAEKRTYPLEVSKIHGLIQEKFSGRKDYVDLFQALVEIVDAERHSKISLGQLTKATTLSKQEILSFMEALEAKGFFDIHSPLYHNGNFYSMTTAKAIEALDKGVVKVPGEDVTYTDPHTRITFYFEVQPAFSALVFSLSKKAS